MAFISLFGTAALGSNFGSSTMNNLPVACSSFYISAILLAHPGFLLSDQQRGRTCMCVCVCVCSRSESRSCWRCIPIIGGTHSA